VRSLSVAPIRRQLAGINPRGAECHRGYRSSGAIRRTEDPVRRMVREEDR